MSKSWDIVAWTADADSFCEACFISIYGETATTDENATDREGNPFHPIFDCHLDDSDVVCGKCFGVIYAAEEASDV